MPAPTTRPLTDTELVRCLHALGVTRRQMAHATGYDPRTVSRWLAGTQTLRAGTRTLLTRLLAEHQT